MKRVLTCALGAASLFAALAAAQQGAPVAESTDDANVAEQEVDAADAPPAAVEACFFVRDIDDFDALSDEFVLVEGRGDENDLLFAIAG